MSDAPLDKATVGFTRDAWLRYLERIDGFRPDLYRYCRRLTGNVWDAEDLVQDALEQGFARIALTSDPIDNPRGYLARIASNLWISRKRHDRLERLRSDDVALSPKPSASPEASHAFRDASAALLEQLAPQERAAVLLKETFEFSLDEIAGVLGTSTGAVKAALHRGRERLRAASDATPPRYPVARAVVDRFVEYYNQRDMPAMLALMLDTASIDMHGAEQFVGRSEFARERGWFHHNFYSPLDGQPSPAVWEAADLDGEPIVLVLDRAGSNASVTSVMRLETCDDRVARLRVYAACPDTVREVAERLGRPCATMGLYHWPRELLERFAVTAH
jgi:RNA polymerase sigma-70 factor (ECF subfamily)